MKISLDIKILRGSLAHFCESKIRRRFGKYLPRTRPLKKSFTSFQFGHSLKANIARLQFQEVSHSVHTTPQRLL